MTSTRRRFLASTGKAATVGVGVASLAVVGRVAAKHEELQPEHVTISYDEAVIKEYRPSFVLQEVDPRPTAWHAFHASSTESDLNAVYGFMSYPFQEGVSRNDSHLGDHEPLIVWYDSTTGDVARVDYSAYHWFRGTALPETLAFADEAKHRPIMRVDPTYHHHYTYQGDIPGADVPIEDLTASMPSWLNNGLEAELALSQPYDPWRMLSRNTWWRHSAMNYVDASIKALWFNLGFAGAAETSDVEEVQAW